MNIQNIHEVTTTDNQTQALVIAFDDIVKAVAQ